METTNQPGQASVVVPLPPDPPPFEGDDDPKPAPPKEDAGGKSGKPKDEAGELRKQLADQAKRIDELSASERYWADQARGGKGGEPKAGEPDEEIVTGDLTARPDGDPEEEPTADAFLDSLTTLGPKAIEKELKRRGYVSKTEVAKLATDIAKRVVEKERGKITSDAQIVSQYPELRDESSPLFQETGKIYREIVAVDPKLAKSPATLLLAAKQAKLALQLQASRNGKGNAEGQDYREREPDERRRRIDAQAGDTGRGRGAPSEGDDDEIGPEARQVVTMFSRYGVNDDNYRAERAKDRRRAA